MPDFAPLPMSAGLWAASPAFAGWELRPCTDFDNMPAGRDAASEASLPAAAEAPALTLPAAAGWPVAFGTNSVTSVAAVAPDAAAADTATVAVVAASTANGSLGAADANGEKLAGFLAAGVACCAEITRWCQRHPGIVWRRGRISN